MFLTAPTTIAQVLILAIGIYLLLSFLRTTRGSGLVRGLGLALIVGVYGLWGIAGQLGLLELKHVIQGLLGFVFVIIAILFQPELRRGIVSLGENSLLGRFLKAHRTEVVTEVAAALVTMAKKKQGALIAFERKTPLDAYIEGAVKIDAEVNRYLLDSIFHHGNALHDGAVIIRGDRLVAAASLFPLTENVEISKSTGTRHRAALGLTEETDAVTVVVSEETGLLSVCKQGKLERRVPRAQIEEVLRDRLGADETAAAAAQEEEAERPPLILRLFTEHLGQKFGALVLALLVFYGAHQDIIVPQDVPLRIEMVESGADLAPAPGTLQMVISGDYRLVAGSARECMVRFEGTRDQLDVLKAGVGGIVNLPPDLKDGELEIDAGEVTWTGALVGESVSRRWLGDSPVVLVENHLRREIELVPSMVQIVTKDLDSRYVVDPARILFRPSSVFVRGPVKAVEELERLVELHYAGTPPEEGPPHVLEPVTLGERDTERRSAKCGLAAHLRAQRLEMEGQVEVDVPISHRRVELLAIETPIRVVHLDPSVEPKRAFEPVSEAARFKIIARGLLSGEQGSAEWIADSVAIRDFVIERLRAFVDADRIPPGSKVGTVVAVGLENWRDRLPEVADRFRAACKDERSELRVELETSRDVHLVETTTSGEGEASGPGGEDT